MHIVDDNMESIHRRIMELFSKGEYEHESAPRGKPIREFIGAKFVLTNPRNRLITSPARGANYGFGVGELCWYVRGDLDLETMLYYNKRMALFSDDGKTINSAYGRRMFRNRWAGDRFSGMGDEIDDRSQFDNAIAELKGDPNSRRAVMHINEPDDLNKAVKKGSKDVPCTMSLQLFIRDRRLHMHVLMRSNDVVWGVPYDVFSFTMLQESFLRKLQEEGVEVDDLGSYHHTAGSLHLYDTHYTMAEEVAGETHQPPPPMKPFTLDELRYVAEEVEPQIRRDTVDGGTCGGDWVHMIEEPLAGGQDAESTPAWMVDRLLEHREKRLQEAAREYARRDAALTELVRMTEEAGGYAELTTANEEKNV
jgi:thymidylate synthase